MRKSDSEKFQLIAIAQQTTKKSQNASRKSIYQTEIEKNSCASSLGPYNVKKNQVKNIHWENTPLRPYKKYEHGCLSTWYIKSTVCKEFLHSI